MTEPKFKVGDRVEVVANRTGFGSFIGRKGTVYDVCPDEGYVLLDLDGYQDDISFEFYPEEVTKID